MRQRTRNLGLNELQRSLNPGYPYFRIQRYRLQTLDAKQRNNYPARTGFLRDPPTSPPIEHGYCRPLRLDG